MKRIRYALFCINEMKELLKRC